MSNQSKPPHIPEPESGVLVHAEEQEPSLEEAALAEALARALDAPAARHGAAHDQGLGGLIETATLVKASRNFELSAEQSRRGRAELEGFIDAHERKKARAKTTLFGSWAIRLPLIAVGLAGAIFILRVERAGRRESAPAELAAAPPVAAKAIEQSEAMPAVATQVATHPPAALLRAQADALARAASAETGVTPPRAELDRELEAYRERLIASLDGRLR